MQSRSGSLKIQPYLASQSGSSEVWISVRHFSNWPDCVQHHRRVAEQVSKNLTLKSFLEFLGVPCSWFHQDTNPLTCLFSSTIEWYSRSAISLAARRPRRLALCTDHAARRSTAASHNRPHEMAMSTHESMFCSADVQQTSEDLSRQQEITPRTHLSCAALCRGRATEQHRALC